MRVIARSADGVIEAVRRDDHPFYLGVQWHPERTEDQQLGIGVIRQLVDACKSAGA
jgi:putative glutamine amidotransferase